MRIHLKLLICCILLFSVFFYPSLLKANNKVYNISLSYKNNEIKMTNLLVRQIDEQIAVKNNLSNVGEFSYELVSFQGVILEKGNFDFLTPMMGLETKSEVRLLGDPGSEEVIELTETVPASLTVIQILYHTDGDKINIYDSKKELKLTLDVSVFSEGCGNKKCEAGESAANCPTDCQLVEKKVTTTTNVLLEGCGNKKCEAGESAANCPTDCLVKAEENNKTKLFILMIPVVLVAVLIPLFLYYFLVRKKNSDTGM